MIDLIEAWVTKWATVAGLPPIYSDTVDVSTPTGGVYAILTVVLDRKATYYRGFKRDFYRVMVEIYSTGTKVDSAALAKLVLDNFDDPAKLTFDLESATLHCLTRQIDSKEAPSPTRTDTRVATMIFIVTTISGR